MNHTANRDFLLTVARAFAGAIVFSFPLLMTMEMWWFGFSMSRWRLAVLLTVLIPILIGVSRVSGFDKHWHLREAMMDAMVALFVAFVVSASMLTLFGEIRMEYSFSENVRKVAIQIFPASIGAMISRSLLDVKEHTEELTKHSTDIRSDLFLRFVGALVLGMTAAPTEEMILIAHQISRWNAIIVATLSLLVMHSFVYGVELQLHKSLPRPSLLGLVFVRSTIGYAMALVVSAWILWSFGRFDGMGASQILVSTVVLGFATNLGAAAVRVVL